MPRKPIDPSLPELYLVYKITNTINGKVYIGAHKTKSRDDGYMGSGNWIKRAISKHGRKNFKKEILFELNSEQEMYDKEREIVQVGDGFYNLINGGGFPIVFTEEIRKKIGNANAIAQLGKGNSQYGTIWVNDGINNKKISSDAIIPEGYVKGRIVRDFNFTWLKWEENKIYGRHFINNGEKNFYVSKSEPIPEGYSKGRMKFHMPYKKPSKNFTQSMLGTRWITDGTTSLTIKKDDPIPDGFYPGKVAPTGWIWITDGIKNMKLEKSEPIPHGFWNGKSKLNAASPKEVHHTVDVHTLQKEVLESPIALLCKKYSCTDKGLQRSIVKRGIFIPSQIDRCYWTRVKAGTLKKITIENLEFVNGAYRLIK